MYSIDTEDLPVTPTVSMDPDGPDAGRLVKREAPSSAERPAAAGGGEPMMTEGARDASPMEGIGTQEEPTSDATAADGASAAGASIGADALNAANGAQPPLQEGSGLMERALGGAAAEAAEQEAQQPPAQAGEAPQPPAREQPSAPGLQDGLPQPPAQQQEQQQEQEQQEQEQQEQEQVSLEVPPVPAEPTALQAGEGEGEGRCEQDEQAAAVGTQVVELKKLLENAKTTIQELNTMLVRYEEENARLRQLMEGPGRPGGALAQPQPQPQPVQQLQAMQAMAGVLEPNMKAPGAGPIDAALAPPLPTGGAGLASPQTNHFRVQSGDSQFSLGSSVSSLATGTTAASGTGGVKRPRPEGLADGPGQNGEGQQQQQELAGVASGLSASASSTGSATVANNLGATLNNALVLGGAGGEQQQQQQAGPGVEAQQQAGAKASGGEAAAPAPAAAAVPAAPVKNYRKSCDFCTSTKIRCDGAKPTCENCAKRQIPCHYSERKRPGPKINSSFTSRGGQQQQQQQQAPMHWPHPTAGVGYPRHPGAYGHGPPPAVHHAHHAGFPPQMPGIPPLAPSYAHGHGHAHAHAPALHHHQMGASPPPNPYGGPPVAAPPHHYMGAPMHGAAGGAGMEPHMAASGQQIGQQMGHQHQHQHQHLGHQHMGQPQAAMQMGQHQQHQQPMPQLLQHQHPQQHPQQQQLQQQQQQGQGGGPGYVTDHAEAAAALMNMPLRMAGPGQAGGGAPAPGMQQMPPGGQMGMAPPTGHGKLYFPNQSQG